MSKNEKEKIRKMQKRTIVILAIILFMGVLNFKPSFLKYSNSVAITANEMQLIDDMMFKSPVIKRLEVEIDKLAIEEAKRIEEGKARQLELDKNKKIAYLTFDDGPSFKSTPKILEILKNNEIEATFFILGSMAERNPETLKKVHMDGHAIGHHSYSHDYNHIYSSPDNFMGELRKTDRLFKNILGEDFNTKLLRFPGGEFGNKKKEYARIANKEGYISHNWNALNGDSEGHNMSQNYLLNRLKVTVGNQKEVVILMHDTDAKATTVKSLQASIDFLKSKGYVFRKLPQP